MSHPIAVALIFREDRPLLAPTLASLSRESLVGFELIAIDDSERGNADGSSTWLSHLTATWPELCCRRLRGPGQGFAAAANLALAQTTAPLITFLSPGDRIQNGKINGAVQIFQDQPQLQQLLCGRQLINHQGDPLMSEQPWQEHITFSWGSLLQHRQMPTSCWTMRRQAALDAGGFNPNHGALAPLDLALRLAGAATTSAWQSQVLIRQHPDAPAPWRTQLAQLRQLLEPHWQRLPASHQAWAAETRLDLNIEGAAMAWCAGDTPGAIEQLQQVPDWSAMPLARRGPRLMEHLHRTSCRSGKSWDRQAVLQSSFWRHGLSLLQRP